MLDSVPRELELVLATIHFVLLYLQKTSQGSPSSASARLWLQPLIRYMAGWTMMASLILLLRASNARIPS